LSASLAADQTGLASLTTTVGTKLAKSSNLSDLTNAETARTNLGLGSAATSDTGDFATASHTHAASDITSGTFGASRIPNLAASKITTGTFATGRISEGSVTQHEGALTITEAQISDLGTYSTATGVEDNANNYSLPAAASDTRGGVKIGYSENGKNYPVELSSEKMFVNVPWTDTNTTYTVGDGGLTQNNFTDALKTKLDGISTSADVTDATTVAAAGALMDSEVTNLTQVKAFDSSDYATAAQGTKADNALPKAGGTMTGAIILDDNSGDSPSVQLKNENDVNYQIYNGSSDNFIITRVGNNGADFSINGSSTNYTNTTLTLAGAEISATKIGNWNTAYGWGNHASAGYSTATGVENNADVTDTANVTAAGALMDSELTNLAAVKAINQSLVTTADVTFGSVSISNGKIEFNSNTDVDTGTETIATATGADAAFFDYVVKNGTNVRAGTITAVTDGTNVEFNEVSTVDLGDTRGVKLSVVLSSGNLLLKATVTSDNWNIQSFVRQIEL